MLLALVQGFSVIKVSAYHAGDDSSLGPRISERLFIADSVLDDHNRSLSLVHRRTKCGHCRSLVNGLVRAHNIVECLVRLGRRFDHAVRDDGVFAVVGRVDDQALS